MNQPRGDKAVIGGVLTIISGAIGVLGGVLFIFVSLVLKYGSTLLMWTYQLPNSI